jgi:hypothetical protein
MDEYEVNEYEVIEAFEATQDVTDGIEERAVEAGRKLVAWRRHCHESGLCWTQWLDDNGINRNVAMRLMKCYDDDAERGDPPPDVVWAPYGE